MEINPLKKIDCKSVTPMSKFIRFTNFILNANDIHKIVIHPNKYCFHIATKQINGFNWSIGWFGLGNISSYNYEFDVCETTHSNDYKIVSDWINQNAVFPYKRSSNVEGVS